MAHPQNSHRGLLSKSRVDVGTDGAFFLDYSANTALLTANSTGLVHAGDITIGTHILSTNSTGLTVNGAEVSTA